MMLDTILASPTLTSQQRCERARTYLLNTYGSSRLDAFEKALRKQEQEYTAHSNQEVLQRDTLVYFHFEAQTFYPEEFR